MSKLLQDIASILPASQIISDPLRRLAYGSDASFYRMTPELVLWVESEAQVQALLQVALAHGRGVTYRAAGTSLSGQAVTDGLLVLIGEGFARCEIAADAATVRMGPAMIGGEVNARLAPFQRKIGPDPASINACKIGGIAANNASGMCCGTSQNSYQTLVGMRLMLADGSLLDTEDEASVASFRVSHADLLSELARLGAATRTDAALAARIRHKYRIKNTTGYSLNAMVDFEDPLEILTHLMIGSEGTLGVITEAWVRVQPRPQHRASRAVRFGDFLTGAEAAREIVQSGLDPANCRLLDQLEAQQTGAGDGAHSVLVIGFESTDAAVDHELERALEIAASHGGEWDAPSGSRPAAEGNWREAFIKMPYIRDMLVQLGILADTFETAITWDRFPPFHEAVVGATREALGEPCRVSCRFTHLYPDGPAPYYTVLAPARRGDEVAQWHEMKQAAGDAIIAAGGTITHHHAVGRDHRPWYDEQRPDLFAAALGAAKREIDPAGILNPGVLLD